MSEDISPDVLCPPLARPRVLEPGEVPESGVYPMPDLPPMVRLILSELVRTDESGEYVYDFYGNHACEWPDGVRPPREAYFAHCNCGAPVEFAKRLAAGIDPRWRMGVPTAVEGRAVEGPAVNRATWIAAAFGTTVTAVIAAVFFLAVGYPHPWVAVPIAIVAYPLAGLALNKAADWYMRRRTQ